MSTAVQKKVELDELALNLEYAFNRGVDIQNRVIRLTEDIEEHHFDWFDAAMNLLESDSPRKTITIKINSYGGDVYAALGIIGRMRESNARIHTKGYGKIMSASTAILAAGDKRSMSELAVFMHHESSYDAGYGRESEHLDALKQSQSLSERWCFLMEELTGTPAEFWRTRGVRKDEYMSPDKCIELNVVDELF